MAKQSKDWTSFIVKLLLVVPSLFKVSNHVVACIGHDARRAKKGVIGLMMLFVLAIPIVSMAWLCLSGLIFFWLLTWVSPITAICLLLVVNLILLLIIVWRMKIAKSKLSFELTRSLLE